MPSEAQKSLDANLKEIERLLALHTMVGGTTKGRRYGLEVLNKSAVVLITAYWEAYCEDIAAEALAHIVTHATSSNVLPNELKKQVAKELKQAPNELEVWKIADLGWKTYLSSQLEKLREQRNRQINTPKTEQIDLLFRQAVGIAKISLFWKGPKKMTVNRATGKLDKYVTLRGDIAHRGKGSVTVKKAQVEDYFDFIKNLATKTGAALNSHVKEITRRPLWS
jgi:hypothetical protein